MTGGALVDIRMLVVCVLNLEQADGHPGDCRTAHLPGRDWLHRNQKAPSMLISRGNPDEGYVVRELVGVGGRVDDGA